MKRALSTITLIALTILCAGISNAENDWRLRNGQNARLKGNLIAIDPSFLKAINNNPRFVEWSKNYYELIYLISIEYKPAIKTGFVLLSSEWLDKSASLYENIGDIAVPLYRTHSFWDQLAGLDKTTIQQVAHYYEENTEYGNGRHFQNMKKTILLGIP